MRLIDETHQLEELMDAQRTLKNAADAIDRIANKVHGNAAEFSRRELDRIRQQQRANREACKAYDLENENATLRSLLLRSRHYLENDYAHDYGDCSDDPVEDCQACQLRKEIDTALAKRDAVEGK